MAPNISKLLNYTTTDVTCNKYVHSWARNCIHCGANSFLITVYNAVKIYSAISLLSLLLKRKLPGLIDLQKTLQDILQSSFFLGFYGCGFPLFICSFRQACGSLNLLTVSGLPSFLASFLAILIEKPARRKILALYVSNLATESVWKWMVSRNIVKNIKYGNVIVFTFSMTCLVYYYKSGIHKKKSQDKDDMIFNILRKYLVGPYEEKNYTQRPAKVYQNPSISQLNFWNKNITKLKNFDQSHYCPHPYSCLFQISQRTGKMFLMGLGLQITLKMVLNTKTILYSPKALTKIIFKQDNLRLAKFLGGFSGVLQLMLCLLRRNTGKDKPSYAIPATILAGLTFSTYGDTNIALYVFWKALEISYTLGVNKKFLHPVPYFTEFLYSFSAAILFHVALVEPIHLRPSYWKFLDTISGGRFTCMNRNVLDLWGFKSSEQLAQVLIKTNTKAVVKSFV